jgi:hypothetical protein
MNVGMHAIALMDEWMNESLEMFKCCNNDDQEIEK